MNRLSHALQPARQKRPSATTNTVDVKVVGTLPEQSSLLTLQLSLSTVVQNKVMESRQPTDVKQLSSKTILFRLFLVFVLHPLICM